MIRIVIADDHQLIREGFKRIIEREPDMEFVGATSTAGEVLEMLNSLACDVLVLDIGLPDRSGLDLLKDLVARFEKLKVIVLSMHPESSYALRAMRSGAWGYVCKGTSSKELLIAIRKVAADHKYLSESFAESLAGVLFGEDTKQPHESLSDREFQVLLHLGSGLSVSEIGSRLGISVNTVNTYRRRLIEKMRFETNADVVRYVLEHELL